MKGNPCLPRLWPCVDEADEVEAEEPVGGTEEGGGGVPPVVVVSFGG
jgi:hypothetical protein